ncbi:U2 small nuclear ribonucleoprotein A' [Linnemannia schmuckeri]|uniref:U2 small nuclear ribonucleoprotein A' n=1 Tax=Linnemannia schmuckeri TaxID=64567 RepID=A0A9P5V933_9FUNG|nr:U2 small nuclear ribonucleoprotein A' [Linnemannia schmuckeri]
MKLTPDLIARAPCYLNALQDRELDLRSHKIPAIENLGVTKDLNDSLDLTDNDIRALSNFPVLYRLKTLLLSNNRISKIDPELLTNYLPNLTTLVLTNNALAELSDLQGLAGAKFLEHLVLLDNPLTKKKYYRLYVIWKLPTVRVLDFTKVARKERQEAKKLFDGKAGPSALAESIAATKSATSTFEPGEGVPLPLKSSVPTLTMSKEDQDKIKAALAKATTLDEISRLERALKEGKIPSELKDQQETQSRKKQKLDDGEQEEEEEEEDTPMA